MMKVPRFFVLMLFEHPICLSSQEEHTLDPIRQLMIQNKKRDLFHSADQGIAIENPQCIVKR